MSRPLDVYEEICAGQGLSFEGSDDGIIVSGALSSGYFKIPGDISSQFISGLMFALPLLDGYSVIELIPPRGFKALYRYDCQCSFEVWNKNGDDLR